MPGSRDFWCCHLYPIGYNFDEADYQSASGRQPVWDYLEQLSNEEQVRVWDILRRIEQYGFGAGGVQFRQIERKLWEMKIEAQRIFYVVLEQGSIVLLHAYKKQSNKLPRREYEVAIKRMKEVLL